MGTTTSSSATEAYPMAPPLPSSCYSLDRECLIPGHDYESQFLSGLQTSRMILLLITEASVQGFKTAHLNPDNVLLEWEMALALDTGQQVTYSMFRTDVFPEERHCHVGSVARGGEGIRSTVGRLFKMQGVLPSQLTRVAAHVNSYEW
ncbi:hypothetical protein HDV00_007725 [Rhizophlyctis rosea]|nr:hypothetical protein HDV00_007725 [Rhizophlyctis rosea]